MGNGAGAVVARLRAHRVEVGEAILVRVRDGVTDAVGATNAEYAQGLRDAVTAGIDYVLEGLEQAESGQAGTPSRPVPSAAIEQARRAARTGVGLDTVLRRYVAGYTLLEDFVMREAEHADFAGETAELRRLLSTAAILVDHVITAVTSAYRDEVRRAARSLSKNDPPPAASRPAASGGGATVSPEPVAETQPASAAGVHPGQRERILTAMIQVVAERGFAGASVKLVTARAAVSSRTFYEQFESLRDCFEAVLDLGLQRAGELIARAFAREDSWEDGARSALASLLVLLDSEPELARCLFVEVLATGSWVLQRRERIVAQLRAMIVEHWPIPGDERLEPWAIAGVMESVLGLIQTHLIAREPAPLMDLLGPMMGLVTAQYLDAHDVAREVQRGQELARAIQAGDGPGWLTAPAPAPSDGGPDKALLATLANPSAHRARECLLFLAGHPDSSNREIAAGIGISHQSQISKLLCHLAGEDLASKRSEGVGKPNAWRLTRRGEQIARTLAGDPPQTQSASIE